jgi:hypothetical protein
MSVKSSAWRRLRRQAELRLEAAGFVVCWRCGQIVTPQMRWHLGHVVDRALGGDENELSIEHEECSRASGYALGRSLMTARNSACVFADEGELFPSSIVLS